MFRLLTNTILLLTSLAATTQTAYGQVPVRFKFDTARVYLNENLDDFLSEIEKSHLSDYNDKNAIPVSLKEQLELITHGFSMANPNEEYRCCCTSAQSLPYRKLLFLSLNKDLLIMTYLTGGIGVSTHILFVRFRDNNIQDIWNAQSFEELKSKRNIIKFIKKNRNNLDRLHPNFDI